MEIFYNTVFVCFFYFILGKSFINLKNNFSNTCLIILIGAILLSVFALCFHFIAKLSIFNVPIALVVDVSKGCFWWKSGEPGQARCQILSTISLIGFSIF